MRFLKTRFYIWVTCLMACSCREPSKADSTKKIASNSSTSEINQGAGLSAAARASSKGLASSSKLKIYVSIPPQAYFMKRLESERLDVEFLVAPGQCAESFELTAQQLAQMTKAKIFFRIGMPFEETLATKLQQIYPALKIVDLRDGIPLSPMHDAHAGESRQGLKDPHFWLDPQRMMIATRSMAKALIEIDPTFEPRYQRNLEQLLKDLKALDQEIAALLKPHQGQTLFAVHGAYRYFCERYHLRQVDLEEEGKTPSVRAMEYFVKQVRSSGAKVIFAQSESSKEAQAVAQQLKSRLITVDPLVEDYPANIRFIAQAIHTHLASGHLK